MAAARFVRTSLAALALVAPFVAATVGASSLVGPLAANVTEQLLRVTAPLVAEPISAPEPEPEPEPGADGHGALSFEAATNPARKGRKAPSSKPKPSALFVSEATVLKLSQSAARPRGAFVQETDQHPAGLRLSGVAALGIGLQDGDILIEALGMTPRAPEQVIGAILEARAKQARFLSGTVWRSGQTFRITVEQPYLPQPA